jgi:transposase
MKKDSIAQVSLNKPRHRQQSKGRLKEVKRSGIAGTPEQSVGLDIGDNTSRYLVVDSEGVVKTERGVPTTKKGLSQAFASMVPSRIAMEVGTHSPWVSRLLQSFGHEVIVANARRVRLIGQSSRKNDKQDAKLLARLARVDPSLLCPIQHRGEQAQEHLAMIKARAALVEGRTALVNTARGLTKSFGERLGKCDADQMGVGKLAGMPAGLQAVLEPLLVTVETMTENIQGYDKQLAEIAREHYPETALLEQISGVGQLIALTFILTLDDPNRFQRSREVGCFLGLRPKQRDSGESQPQLGISKEGDVYLRKLLVQGAHCILSRRGPDTDLKRWGLKLAGQGSKNAKKIALVAVARKLAILLHHLWVTGEVYEPLRNSQVVAVPAEPAA